MKDFEDNSIRFLNWFAEGSNRVVVNNKDSHGRVLISLSYRSSITDRIAMLTSSISASLSEGISF